MKEGIELLTMPSTEMATAPSGTLDLQREDGLQLQLSVALEPAAGHGKVDHPSFPLFSGKRKDGRQVGLNALELATIDRMFDVAPEQPEGLETVRVDLAAKGINVKMAQQILPPSFSVNATNETSGTLWTLSSY